MLLGKSLKYTVTVPDARVLPILARGPISPRALPGISCVREGQLIGFLSPRMLDVQANAAKQPMTPTPLRRGQLQRPVARHRGQHLYPRYLGCHLSPRR